MGVEKKKTLFRNQKKITKPGGPLGKRQTWKRRNDIRIATWNVRSLYRPGALKILSNEALKYKLGILALQEIRWTGSGIMDQRDYSIL